MTETFNGCSYTDVWASPKNWATTTSKSALNKDWYVQCNFHDPLFKEKNGNNGFQFRRRLNKIKGLENRQAAVRLMLEEIPKLLSEQGYNPITGLYMAPLKRSAGINRNPVYNHETPIKNALDLAYRLADVEDQTLRDFKSVLRYFKKALRKIGYHTLQIGFITTLHIRQVMMYLVKHVRPLSDKRFNKYIANLGSLFTILRKNGLIKANPMDDFDKKIVVIEQRQTMTVAERIKVDRHLRINHPRFWLYTVIFYHSAGREDELLYVKPEHVDLENLTYKSLVKKGGRKVWVSHPIKKIAVEFWQKAMLSAKPTDYIFSVGLVPGEQKIRRDQITRRWRIHVKEKLGITADIYSLKHSNLDEITQRLDAKAAARAAGHTSTRMINKHYAVNEKDRLNVAIQNMTNQFAPERKATVYNETCNPMAFGFTVSRSAG
jgi:integrase